MEVTVDPDGNRAVVTIPGFSFQDFDRTGHLSLRSVQANLTAARFLAYHTQSATGHSFLEYDKLTENLYTFMASTETTAERELYDLTRKDCVVSKTKFAVVIQLGYVGNSSLSSTAKLITHPEGKVLVSNVNQVVTVDKTTRKPTTLSEWWKERYHSYATSTKPLIVSALAVPENTHSYSVKVPWTDIDNYKHTNYLAYIRYCIDAAMDATANKVYTKVKHDFLQYPIQSMRISYKGESVANDNLIVKTWENADNPLALHFSIERSGVILSFKVPYKFSRLLINQSEFL